MSVEKGVTNENAPPRNGINQFDSLRSPESVKSTSERAMKSSKLLDDDCCVGGGGVCNAPPPPPPAASSSRNASSGGRGSTAGLELSPLRPPPPSSTRSSSSINKPSSTSSSSSSTNRFGFTRSIPVKSSGYGRVSVGGGGAGARREEQGEDKGKTYADATRKARNAASRAKNSNNSSSNSSSNSSVAPPSNRVSSIVDRPKASSPKTPVTSALKRTANNIVSSLCKAVHHGSPRHHHGHGGNGSARRHNGTGGGGTGRKSSQKGYGNSAVVSISTPSGKKLFPSHILTTIDPTTSQVRSYHGQIFGEGSGVSDGEIKTVLGRRVQGKRWEMKKQIAEYQDICRRTKVGSLGPPFDIYIYFFCFFFFALIGKTTA